MLQDECKHRSKVLGPQEVLVLCAALLGRLVCLPSLCCSSPLLGGLFPRIRYLTLPYATATFSLFAASTSTVHQSPQSVRLPCPTRYETQVQTARCDLNVAPSQRPPPYDFGFFLLESFLFLQSRFLARFSLLLTNKRPRSVLIASAVRCPTFPIRSPQHNIPHRHYDETASLQRRQRGKRWHRWPAGQGIPTLRSDAEKGTKYADGMCRSWGACTITSPRSSSWDLAGQESE